MIFNLLSPNFAVLFTNIFKHLLVLFCEEETRRMNNIPLFAGTRVSCLKSITGLSHIYSLDASFETKLFEKLVQALLLITYQV